jgi:hypothetical protein
MQKRPVTERIQAQRLYGDLANQLLLKWEFMTFRRIHTDQTYWFSVFRSDQTGDHVLYAALKEKDSPEIAIRLAAPEVEMFRERPVEFLSFARDFIASHETPLFSSRKISFRTSEPEVLETA